MEQTRQPQDISMDAGQLYREDVYTDNRVGSIRELTPVTAQGEIDDSRSVQYVGSTQILTPAGSLPLSFELPGETLAQAVDAFGDAAREAIDQTMEELREMQRQAASQIVVPKGDVDPGKMGGGMGGMGGGGIRMP